MPQCIKSVGIIGTGVIGASWTALFLAQGLQVLVSDPGADAESKLAADLRAAWPTMEALGLAPGASLKNYRFVGASLAKYYGEVDFIQENAPEKLGLKCDLVGEIDAGAREDVIIASSSSGIPSSQFIVKCKKNPGRVMIGHPFNPPHLMPLVEVVPHPDTSRDAIEAALSFYRSMGKTPILLKQEAPGFVANRLQAAVCVESYSLVSRGVLSAEDLDLCMTNSLGPRWALTGPFIANVMGGGGGRAGFKHMLQHLGPAMEGWISDMRANEYKFTSENLDELDNSVQRELDHHDLAAVEKDRDEVLIHLLKEKKVRPALT